LEGTHELYSDDYVKIIYLCLFRYLLDNYKHNESHYPFLNIFEYYKTLLTPQIMTLFDIIEQLNKIIQNNIDIRSQCLGNNIPTLGAVDMLQKE